MLKFRILVQVQILAYRLLSKMYRERRHCFQACWLFPILCDNPLIHTQQAPADFMLPLKEKANKRPHYTPVRALKIWLSNGCGRQLSWQCQGTAHVFCPKEGRKVSSLSSWQSAVARAYFSFCTVILLGLDTLKCFTHGKTVYKFLCHLLHFQRFSGELQCF